MNRKVEARRAVFAIPGDLTARTGGYIYGERLAQGLRTLGWQFDILNLGRSFPNPTPADMAAALASLAAVPADTVLLVDGLAFGALDTVGLTAVKAPICALVHHPLALESGVAPDRATVLRQLETANLTMARQVIVTSSHTAATLAHDFGVPEQRITVALPGTDRPEKPSQPSTVPHILAVGSLTQRKGHDVLMAALASLTDLEWTAEIVGGPHDPAVTSQLKAQRAALGLEQGVQFIGELERTELDACYARASLFALATRNEGYGMVFTEATANGLPIVSCATGALPETAPKDSSILVPPDDPPAFAAALRSILTNPALMDRLTNGAPAAAADLPTWEQTVSLAGIALAKTMDGPAV
jgi:glycosyltransferase involved in cell wall biosynthesis